MRRTHTFLSLVKSFAWQAHGRRDHRISRSEYEGCGWKVLAPREIITLVYLDTPGCEYTKN